MAGMSELDGDLLDQDILLRRKAFPEPLCEEIVSRFERDANHEAGRTEGGASATKTSIDLDPYVTPGWSEISGVIRSLLSENLKFALSDPRVRLSMCREAAELNPTRPQIQCYRRGLGRFDWHLDSFGADGRILAGIANLNSVDEGGQTEFWGRASIRPEAGAIVLFPPSWTHVHRGCVPLSSDKFVMTWFYEYAG